MSAQQKSPQPKLRALMLAQGREVWQSPNCEERMGELSAPSKVKSTVFNSVVLTSSSPQLLCSGAVLRYQFKPYPRIWALTYPVNPVATWQTTSDMALLTIGQ